MHNQKTVMVDSVYVTTVVRVAGLSVKWKVGIPAYCAVFHRPGMQWVWSTYAANPHSIRGLSCNRESQFLLTETARIKQNRAENAKPSRFSRVFSEVPGSLRRIREFSKRWSNQANTQKTPEIRHFRGLSLPKSLWSLFETFEEKSLRFSS